MSEQKAYRAAIYIRVANPEHLADNKKTALYCRLAQVDDLTVEMQERFLRKHAEENGCVHPSTYIDNGGSGLTLDRPAMNRLLSDIRGGMIDTVIAKDSTRIARGYAALFQFYAEARKYGVKVETVMDGGTSFIVEKLFEDIAAELAGSYR